VRKQCSGVTASENHPHSNILQLVRSVNPYGKALMAFREISRECTHSSLTMSIEMIKSSL